MLQHAQIEEADRRKTQPATSHALQHTATHCNTLQHTATHCNTRRQRWRIGARRSTPRRTHCDTPQRTASHCNILPHTVTHYCNALHHTARRYNTLQHAATHCNTLQHTATHAGRGSGPAQDATRHVSSVAAQGSGNTREPGVLRCVAVCCSEVQ